MKKIILLMLMLSPFAKADMDYVCNIVLNDFLDLLTDSGEMATMIKSKGCERNNILFLTLLENSELNLNLQIASALWCRHDRNEKVVANTLRCVLYDTKPRKYLR